MDKASNPNGTKKPLDKELLEAFECIVRITGKLTRSEQNAIMGIIKSHKNEAEYYRQKFEELKKAHDP